MARLPALVSALATVDGRERTVLDFTARIIREGGAIQTTKRGSGAAPMTARDAANLLIGLHGADSPKDAAAAVPRFRSLQRLGTPNPELSGAFAMIDAAETFGEALEIAVEQGRELTDLLARYCVETNGGSGRDAAESLMLGELGVSISLRRPRLSAAIRVWRQVGSDKHYGPTWEYVMAQKLRREGFYGPNVMADRTITVEIGFRTLLALADALRS